ncbi:GAF domain-containing protein [Streptomyces sp. NPDC058378]|uniref:GAF domain-containing protein n=1 Tax=Streptomyces sp. NPDC058378 TaxID=3346469 RepID=UPI00365CA1B6
MPVASGSSGTEATTHAASHAWTACPWTRTSTPAGQALRSGVPAFFADPAEMTRAYPRASVLSEKHAWAFLPLVVSDRRVGCCVLSYDHPHIFGASDRATLVSLGGLIAQAMDRALLYDAKHDLAHGLQQALLPMTLPTMRNLAVAARSCVSFYDEVEVTDAKKLDIDHVVPLAEAWDSEWAAGRREQYADDLGSERSLVAVTAKSNRPRATRTPQWLPPAAAAQCTYASDWVATKLRWKLTIDMKEQAALEKLAGSCPDALVEYEVAP